MRLKLIAAACLSIPLLTVPAWGQDAPQPKCAPIDQLTAMLAAEFQETVVQQGIGQDASHMLLIFAAPDGKSWTAVTVRPDGTACLADAGTDWQTRSDPAPVPEEGL